MVTIRELMKINNIPKIPYKELSISKKVAEGGQGKVYLCKYKENQLGSMEI
jgi:predicted Ser/Thr protein kinase